MATKTITITEDAYSDLKALKLPDESFSEVIKRLKSVRGSIRECVGTWKLASEERKKVDLAIASGKEDTDSLLRRLHAKPT